MKKVRSYTSIWTVEKVIYAVNDLKLPFAVTYSQMMWFVLSFVIVIMLGAVPPLVFIEGAFLKYLGIPLGFTWFMNKKTFDGKKPIGFLRSAITYVLRGKRTYVGRKIKLSKVKVSEHITIVRRGSVYGISD